MEQEIELNFRLDGDGRTANTNEGSRNETKNDAGDPTIDYCSKTTMTNLAIHSNESSNRKLLDDLLFDCEISDCGLMPRTCWVPAKGMAPRCTLEQFALDVFHHHVPSNLNYDPISSGAEWWVQIRPSPEGTGRYSMHDENPDEISKTGISFHWDKDEDLRLLTGGTTYIHPHLSTVTYLTDFGSPTLALNCRVHPLTGEWIVPGKDANMTETGVEGFVSWPKTGKHMSFDGRYLHAAPPDLMEPGSFKRQIQFEESEDPKQQVILKRRHRRVTFLVNIWLNYRPFDVKPFPDTMINKMTGTEKQSRMGLEFVKSGSHATQSRVVTTSLTTLQEESNGSLIVEKTNPSTPQKFTWAMGDCGSDERIEASIPLETIRQEAPHGGNIEIKWAENVDKTTSEICFALYKRTSPQTVALASTKRDLAADETGTNKNCESGKRTRIE